MSGRRVSDVAWWPLAYVLVSVLNRRAERRGGGTEWFR